MLGRKKEISLSEALSVLYHPVYKFNDLITEYLKKHKVVSPVCGSSLKLKKVEYERTEGFSSIFRVIFECRRCGTHYIFEPKYPEIIGNSLPKVDFTELGDINEV